MTESKRINVNGYIAACLVTAAIYALAVGGAARNPALTVVDMLVYAVLLGFTGMTLHNLFRFAVPANYSAAGKTVFIAVLTVFAALFVVAVETFAVYLIFSSLYEQFITATFTRFFITVLIIIIFRLLYLLHHREETSHPAEIRMPEQEPPPLPEINKVPEKSVIDRFTVRSGQKIRIIPIAEVLFIQADGDYVSIHTREGNWLKELTMNGTEAILPPADFVRVHRSFIVNIHSISRIERYGEKQLIILNNGEKIKISAARYRLLKNILSL